MGFNGRIYVNPAIKLFTATAAGIGNGVLDSLKMGMEVGSRNTWRDCCGILAQVISVRLTGLTHLPIVEFIRCGNDVVFS